MKDLIHLVNKGLKLKNNFKSTSIKLIKFNKFFLYFILIFLLINIFSHQLLSQQSDNDINNKIKELNKSFEIQNNTTEENINIVQGQALFRTIIVLIIIIIIFLVLQYFIKKKNLNITIKNEISDIIYREPLTNKVNLGILKIFDRYFLAFISEKIEIIYEITSKEELDQIELIKSKKSNLNQSFIELLREKVKNTHVDYKDSLTKLKEKLNSLKRGKDE